MVVAIEQSSSLRDDMETAGAVANVVNAAERAVEARVDLARAQVTRYARATAISAGAGVIAFTGWIALMIAVVLFLHPRVDPAVSVAVIGGLHVVLGAAAILWATRDRSDHNDKR